MREKIDECPDNAGAFSAPVANASDQLTTMRSNEITGRATLAIRGKDGLQVAIEEPLVLDRQLLLELAVMLFDRVVHHIDGQVVGRDFTADDWRLCANFTHERLDVLELAQYRPAMVRGPPVEAGSQPDRKSLGKIFV